ncbi:UNVERIFIED_CONTAM: hypothetical protein Slati_2690100 [Sesamum latifolium]|uniref:RNase H type-1 domain-containing protein n=1 Tax=Sesamum latifolium TaxID=2727402 RepID=A0AAW2VW82_9LAMI
MQLSAPKMIKDVPKLLGNVASLNRFIARSADHNLPFFKDVTRGGKDSQIEKLVLALVNTARKLRPYFQSHPIVVLTNHPLKQVTEKPNVSGEQGQEKEEGWMLHVGGSSNTTIGEIAVKLNFSATNNEAEYEALVQGLQAAWEGGVKHIRRVHGLTASGDAN